jgi:hypothetical protein
VTLEEIKHAIGEKIDAAWEALKDELDPDAVRTKVQTLTTELYEHVLEVEAHLVNHVLGNSKAAASDPEESGEPLVSSSAAEPDDTSWAGTDSPAKPRGRAAGR